VLQLVRALQELFEMNIVHRDLKLPNILINDQYEIRLADFGFARLKEESQVLKSYCGTPITMAPEILK
jgi:serine/threonine-protein kinase ULK/ATG1